MRLRQSRYQVCMSFSWGCLLQHSMAIAWRILRRRLGMQTNISTLYRAVTAGVDLLLTASVSVCISLQAAAHG
jgi:hypothetical protein